MSGITETGLIELLRFFVDSQGKKYSRSGNIVIDPATEEI